MLPFYLLCGRSLAGISLFAIATEAVALFFLLKISSLLEKRDDIEHSWIQEALALYLLNPATLYWTVLQGYNSIAQTAYSMAALYLLLQGKSVVGYMVGLYGVAGTKLLAVLDWPPLLTVSRPSHAKVFLGFLPVLATYTLFQLISGDILFPLRLHMGHVTEGNIWYLLTAVRKVDKFYSTYPGNVLPVLFCGVAFLFGLVYWLKRLHDGLTSFSFQSAIGMSTFTMAVFFLFSLNTGSWYMSMVMLPASLVVTSPAMEGRDGVWCVLLIAGFCIAGDTLWSALGMPTALSDAFESGPLKKELLQSVLMLTIIVRVVCFARLAKLGLRSAGMRASLLKEPCGMREIR
jgi:hypothetical protein